MSYIYSIFMRILMSMKKALVEFFFAVINNWRGLMICCSSAVGFAIIVLHLFPLLDTIYALAVGSLAIYLLSW